MTKREVIFLLAPSVLFVLMAASALIYASALRPEPQREQRTQKNIDELVRKAQNGEFGPNPEIIVNAVSDAWRARDVVHETVSGFHASLSRRVGYGVLCGVMVQIYVIFRVKAGLRKRDA